VAETLPITIDVEAEREARDAFRWYFDRSPDAAARFEAQLGHVLAAVAEMPLRAVEVEPGVRSMLFPGFPYAVLYSVLSERIVVLAVAHMRRRPGYWRGR